MGITTSGLITRSALGGAIKGYASRIKANGETVSASSVRSFSVRLRTLCGFAYAHHYLRSDHFFGFKIYKVDEDPDIPI